MSPHTRFRNGFTLVELLVTMAVIAVLVALLLPAVNHVREAARRAQCKNNTHQIITALHQYHERSRVFPPGWIGVTNRQHDVNGTSGLGWGAQILPQLEEQNVLNMLDRNLSITNSANVTARAANIPTYRCPSDASSPDIWQIAQNPAAPVNPDLPVNLALSNYVGCYGSGNLHECEDDALGSQCVGNGCFYLNSRVKIEEIKDGSSSTIAIAERKSTATMTPPWYSTWVGAAPGGEESIARILGSTDHRPNSTEHIEDFSSGHGEGIHVGLADGSTKFVANNVEPTIYNGLGTITGKEYIPDIW